MSTRGSMLIGNRSVRSTLVGAASGSLRESIEEAARVVGQPDGTQSDGASP